MTRLQARKILGFQSKRMSDDQIDELLSNFYGLAEIVIDIISKNGSNKQLKVIDSLEERDDNGNS